MTENKCECVIEYRCKVFGDFYLCTHGEKSGKYCRFLHVNSGLIWTCTSPKAMMAAFVAIENGEEE